MKELKSIHTIYGEFKTVVIPKKFQNRPKWAPKNEKQVKSFIPGIITDLFVKEGDTIAKGDLIYEFKAMKMLNKVESEIDGVIKSIKYTIGDSFPKGVIIIEYK